MALLVWKIIRLTLYALNAKVAVRVYDFFVSAYTQASISRIRFAFFVGQGQLVTHTSYHSVSTPVIAGRSFSQGLANNSVGALQQHPQGTGLSYYSLKPTVIFCASIMNALAECS